MFWRKSGPSHAELTELALISWREYIKNKKRIYNMDVCTAYQRGFISAYKRRMHRQNKLDKGQ
jgi:hypothetical protein